jgi:ATP-dependent Clp protease adaptor protein ClpS
MSTETAEIEKIETIIPKEPGKYKVIVCNDDTTPVDFVIVMLVSIFRKSQNEAIDLTLQIHNEGSGIAGVYSFEIAEQKTNDAIALSRTNGWPLVIKVEEA